jgi:hypothetical protein
MGSSLSADRPARSGGAKALGRKRAAYWRSLGYPNLVKAREVSARNRRARKQARLFAEAKRPTPFALDKQPRGVLIQRVSSGCKLELAICCPRSSLRRSKACESFARLILGRRRELPSHSYEVCQLGVTFPYRAWRAPGLLGRGLVPSLGRTAPPLNRTALSSCLHGASI